MPVSTQVLYLIVKASDTSRDLKTNRANPSLNRHLRHVKRLLNNQQTRQPNSGRKPPTLNPRCNTARSASVPRSSQIATRRINRPVKAANATQTARQGAPNHPCGSAVAPWNQKKSTINTNEAESKTRTAEDPQNEQNTSPTQQAQLKKAASAEFCLWILLVLQMRSIKARQWAKTQ